MIAAEIHAQHMSGLGIRDRYHADILAGFDAAEADADPPPTARGLAGWLCNVMADDPAVPAAPPAPSGPPAAPPPPVAVDAPPPPPSVVAPPDDDPSVIRFSLLELR